MAEALHERGWNLALHYHQSTAEMRRFAFELNEQRPDSVTYYQADLKKVPALEHLLTQLSDRHPRIDLIVNNAAVFPQTPLGRIATATFDETIAVNLRAPFMICQGLVERMPKGSCIVNLCDIFGRIPLADHMIYSASKAGLEMLTKSLAMELAPRVRVNAIAPGAALPPAGDQEASPILEAILHQTPLHRIGGETATVQALLYLIENPYVTGQILAVDGGRGIA